MSRVVQYIVQRQNRGLVKSTKTNPRRDSKPKTSQNENGIIYSTEAGNTSVKSQEGNQSASYTNQRTFHRSHLLHLVRRFLLRTLYAVPRVWLPRPLQKVRAHILAKSLLAGNLRTLFHLYFVQPQAYDRGASVQPRTPLQT